MIPARNLTENDSALVAARRQMKTHYIEALLEASQQEPQTPFSSQVKILLFGSTCLRHLEEQGADIQYFGIKSSDVDISLLGSQEAIEYEQKRLKNILARAEEKLGFEREKQSWPKKYALYQNHSTEDLHRLGIKEAREAIQASLLIHPQMPNEINGYFSNFKNPLPLQQDWQIEPSGLFLSHPHELLADKIERQIKQSVKGTYDKPTDILDIYRLLTGRNNSGQPLIDPTQLGEEVRLLVLLHFATSGGALPTYYRDPLALFHNTPENRRNLLEAIKSHITAEGYTEVEKDVGHILSVCQKRIEEIFSARGENSHGKLHLTSREIEFFNALHGQSETPAASLWQKWTRSRKPLTEREPSLELAPLLMEYPKVFSADTYLAKNILNDPQLASNMQMAKERNMRAQYSSSGWRGMGE